MSPDVALPACYCYGIKYYILYISASKLKKKAIYRYEAAVLHINIFSWIQAFFLRLCTLLHEIYAIYIVHKHSSL